MDSEFYATARNFMVDGQLRPNRVIEPRLISALRRLPRERFLPEGMGHLAYSDNDVALGRNRVMMSPMAQARLVQLLRPEPGRTVLAIGGTGYAAAVMADCGARVVLVEEDERIRLLAEAALAAVAPSVEVMAGPLAAGLPARAPFDAILIEGAIAAVPPAIAEQLHPRTGRLATVIMGGKFPHAVIGAPIPGGVSLRPDFDCMTAALPGFESRIAPAIVF